MSYNAKNYFVQGSEELVIAGKVTLTGEAVIVDERPEPIRYVPPSSATSAANAVKDLNALIAFLKEAHLIGSVPPTLTLTFDETEFEVAQGEEVLLGVEASASDGRALAYQWYSNSTSSSEGGSVVGGATEPTFKAPTENTGTVYYYCIVSEATQAATKAFEAQASTIFTVVVGAA